jgi:methylated-DNA-[protein]-cysteine S-methyltransferase
MSGYVLFPTVLGCCGLVWGPAGLLAVQLPEGDEAQTRGRIRRRFPDAEEAAPTPDIQAAASAIAGLLEGEPRDLREIRLDMSGLPDFHRRVYEVVRAIPPGSTLTYGEVAAQLGDRSAAQAVGQAMGRNPFPIVVPCHRVVAAGAAAGGFSARGGVSTKLRLLALEGARLRRDDATLELPL